MFPDDRVPKVTPLRARWVCSRCGNDDQGEVRADLGKPAVDPRYAIGWCDRCTPARRSVRGIVRDQVALVDATYWDRDAFLARQAEAEDNKLLGRYRRGHQLTSAELARVKELIGR